MKLIPRGTNGKSGDFSVISKSLRNHLIRWYTAIGNEADHKLAVNLVHNAKQDEQWIACDCLGDAARPPLLSPAYLSLAGTFYLRRLTNDERPEHHEECPFFRDQTPYRSREKTSEVTPHKRPDGYFEILKPEIMKLAQVPDKVEPDDRARRAAVPRLAKLLWTLIDKAELNQSYGDQNIAGAVGVSDKLRRLLADASAGIEIAPGVPLNQHLHVEFDDPQADLNRLYAGLRKSEVLWPDKHAPQAFAITGATGVKGHKIMTANGADLRIKNRVIKPTIYGTSTEPPFLVIILIGIYSPKIGLAPIRAYAQPIAGKADFIPVDSPLERKTATTLAWFKDKLAAQGTLLDYSKPVFDIKTKAGLCRPDFIVSYINSATGTRKKFILETMGYDTEDYIAAKYQAIEKMQLIAPTYTVTRDQLASGKLTSILMKAVQ